MHRTLYGGKKQKILVINHNSCYEKSHKHLRKKKLSSAVN